MYDRYEFALEIIQDDIDQGEQASCSLCPIALSAYRYFEIPVPKANVDDTSMVYQDEDNNLSVSPARLSVVKNGYWLGWFRPSYQAIAFINGFDDTGEAKPCVLTFTVEDL